MTSVQLPLPSLSGRRKPSRVELDHHFPLTISNSNDNKNISSSSSPETFQQPSKLGPKDTKTINFWQTEEGVSPRLRKFQKDEPVLVGKIALSNDEEVKKLDKEKREEVGKDALPRRPSILIKTGQIGKEIQEPTVVPNAAVNVEFDKAVKMPDFKNKNSTEIGTAIFSTVWENMKKMMGFSPDCLHGGHKNLRGNCVCPKYYEGNLCESIICANNGTRKKAASSFTEQVCVCPYPDFISGKHCEVLRCHNGGKDMGNGHCSCVDSWYNGQFCQFYTSSWLVAVGLPLLGIAMLIICCVVCRLDLCPRRNSRRERRQRRRNQASQPDPPPRSGGNSRARSAHRSTQLNTNHAGFSNGDHHMLNHEQNLIVQENLLNEGMIRQLNGRQYVVRLEQVPNFNPALLLSTESNVPAASFKPMEPPPSYDQAVHCAQLYHDSLPPNYSPPHSSGILNTENGSRDHQRPPLPRFRPPDPP